MMALFTDWAQFIGDKTGKKIFCAKPYKYGMDGENTYFIKYKTGKEEFAHVQVIYEEETGKLKCEYVQLNKCINEKFDIPQALIS